MIEIWVNPACSKCRTAVAALDEAGHDYAIRRYLEDAPAVEEIDDVLGRLGLEPWDIARTPDAKRLGVALPATEPGRRTEWIRLLSRNPSLIQRPIITASDGTTVVARDAETLRDIVRRG